MLLSDVLIERYESNGIKLLPRMKKKSEHFQVQYIIYV